ncbi:MAG: DUF1573 domain-containing protein [Bacteroidota bacterium]
MKNAIKISMLALTLGLMSFSVLPIQKNATQKVIDNASISWKSTTIDVGEIPQGTPKLIEYEFTNTGKTTVIITKVQGSCGCTATDYTKDVIAPGKTAVIKATYNASNVGAFTKTVTVTTNVDSTPSVLTFKGTVLAKS